MRRDKIDLEKVILRFHHQARFGNGLRFPLKQRLAFSG